MSDFSLTPLTPLGNIEPQIDIIGSVTIREVVDFALASIAMRQGQKTAFNKAAQKAFALALPAPGRATQSADHALMWTGPDQYLFEAPTDSHDNIAQILKASFGEAASITEQSGGWCRFDIEGQTSLAVLQRLCALDVETMAKNDATRTLIEHIGVFVLCDKAGQNFRIYGPRSSAGSLHHALITAAASVA